MKNTNKSIHKSKHDFKNEKSSKKTENHSESYHGYLKKKKSVFYVFSVLLIAIGLACLHIYHVSTMFENDRHFSHLSNLEREMTFRTEMGLYYSYYKRIVQAQTFGEGFYQIINDNLTEYPTVINTIQRFNLYPEIAIGFLYKQFITITNALGITVKECWQVERGHGLDPVESCEGLGDETYFYLEAIWMCSGITVALLFIYATFLSGSIAGGILTIICFFYNHGECTRVQWTPPLRESFAFPFLILQMLCVSLFIRQSYQKKSRYPFKVQMICISLVSSLCLCLWQFSQFVLATQVIALYLLYVMGSIDKNTILTLIYGIGLGLLQAFFCLFGNQFLLCSILTCIVASLLFILLVIEPFFAKLEISPEFIRFCCMPIFTFFTLFFKLFINIILQNEDDGHILNILKSKLTDYKDFHTLLYTCSAEFDFLPFDTIIKLCESLLIPAVIIVLIFLSYFCSKSKNKRSGIYSISPEIIYNILQMFAFILMAIFIMRLKLFMTPHLCLIASLLASKKYITLFDSQDIHWATLALLISGMSVRGIKNLHQQRSILGEYTNVPMEELFSWINSETDTKSVFAGPMSLTANLLLSTNRPIVNHPHYENAAIRDRTKKVYSMFSRKSHYEVYNILKELQVDYVVIDHAWCFGESKSGCSMLDLWDIEEPQMKLHPPLCPELFNKVNLEPFQRVFHNDAYTVLRLGSGTVQFRHIESHKL